MATFSDMVSQSEIFPKQLGRSRLHKSRNPQTIITKAWALWLDKDVTCDYTQQINALERTRPNSVAMTIRQEKENISMIILTQLRYYPLLEFAPNVEVQR